MALLLLRVFPLGLLVPAAAFPLGLILLHVLKLMLAQVVVCAWYVTVLITNKELI